MKSTLLSVFLVALIVAGAACTSKSDNSTGVGGVSGSGGTSSAGGAKASGGSGGVDSTKDAAGSGGAPASGGAQGFGGVVDTGGTRGEGGKQSTRGAQGTGGAQAKDGSAGTGGATTGDAGRIDGQGGDGIRTRTINVRGFTFDALEMGSAGEPVLLLHGFPDTSLEWTGLMPVLAANGYHCLAPDQRGYSPGARPTDVDAYRYEELVADAFAIGAELGTRFHVVGHDWGAIVGWLMLQKDPSLIASFTAIAIPHYAVWARSVYDDKEMAGYLSMLNTWMTEGKGEAYWTADQMRRMWSAKPADQREATITHMTEPDTMTAALNWYRASRGHKRVIEELNIWEVNVPTLLIFGSKDIGQVSVTNTAPLMKGPYRLVRPDGAHFIVDEQPKAVADETLAQLRAYPIK
jgi:pimeloyl-ACP methyl ester carboxylesterase